MEYGLQIKIFFVSLIYLFILCFPILSRGLDQYLLFNYFVRTSTWGILKTMFISKGQRGFLCMSNRHGHDCLWSFFDSTLWFVLKYSEHSLQTVILYKFWILHLKCCAGRVMVKPLCWYKWFYSFIKSAFSNTSSMVHRRLTTELYIYKIISANRKLRISETCFWLIHQHSTNIMNYLWHELHIVGWHRNFHKIHF
jgi:hypothetical protein